MRIRTVKPDFWKNPDLAKLSDFTRLLALALLNFADDEGLFLADDALIRGELFPFGDKSSMIRRSIAELSNVGFVKLYNGTNGRPYGMVTTFKIHQKIDRPKPSKIKPYIIFGDESTTNQRLFDDASLLDQGSGNREVEQGSAEVSAPTSDLPKKPQSAQSDADWLASLAANPAYAGISIQTEYGKMTAWCSANRKQPTRRRFVNWLNRAERPMQSGASGNYAGVPQSQQPQARRTPEPPNWRELFRIHYPDNDLANDHRDWSERPSAEQATIATAFRAIPFDERRTA